MDELAEHIAEYAATVDEANKRTLDPVVIALMGADVINSYRWREGARRSDFLNRRIWPPMNSSSQLANPAGTTALRQAFAVSAAMSADDSKR